ncbi:MAG: flagellar basal body L-ring protein FlgH [Rhodothalassiaceae bacterium]
MTMRTWMKSGLALAAAMLLAGCGAAERVANIGKQPDLKPFGEIAAPARPRSLSVPIPDDEFQDNTPASLWRVGARAFFKDQRASRVGDILTVIIAIDDEAELENTTTRSRSAGEDASLSAFLGTPADLMNLGIETDPAVGLTSDSSHIGTGEIEREEEITTVLAAMVVDVLPNGNLVIEGRQEVRVNYDIREIMIAGIVRPQDISSTNTILHTQVAEARIVYGGRGQLMDVQQPRYGQQLYDIIFPF